MNNLTWNEMLQAFRELHGNSIMESELNWIRKAWKILEIEGLTGFSDIEGKYKVYFRYMVLLGVLTDFNFIAYGKPSNLFDLYVKGAEIVKLNPFILGQMTTKNLDTPKIDECWESAVFKHVESEREVIVRAILKNYDGEVGLFASFWMIHHADDIVEGGDSPFDYTTEHENDAANWVWEGCKLYERG